MSDDYWNSTTLEEDLREYKDFYNIKLNVITINNNEKWLEYPSKLEQYLYDGKSYRSTGRITNK